MHQLYTRGRVTLENGADPEWYSTFLDYALENGVAGAEYAEMSASELNSAISRRDYVALFYNALPAAEYAAINSVADGAIQTLPLVTRARRRFTPSTARAYSTARTRRAISCRRAG